MDNLRGQDFKKEGTTTFDSQPTSTYRYRVEIKNEKLSFWLEDHASKKQWYKGDMSVSDYVSPANKIPDAMATDYAKCFYDSLSGAIGDPSHMQCKVTALKDDRLQLEFTTSSKTLHFNWSMNYSFELDPVSVERIDILESKLRDQQEELEKLHDQQGEIENLRAEMKANNQGSFACLQASTKVDITKLCWGKVESEVYDINGEDGIVKICKSGVYIIQVFVQSAPTAYDQEASLLINGECNQSYYCTYIDGNYSSTPLGISAYLDEGDELTVTCMAKIAQSLLSIANVGN